jgi:hypothetical protein
MRIAENRAKRADHRAGLMVVVVLRLMVLVVVEL